MNTRKIPLNNGQYYHIVSRSISKLKIFTTDNDYKRFLELLDLYRYKDFHYRFSRYKELNQESQDEVSISLKNNSKKIVDIISYVILPTHIQLILRQNEQGGITSFMGKVLNSYSKYFNAKYRRLGPLWEGHFRNVLIENNKQLLHMTRYHHLNASVVELVKNPFDWRYSSIHEYCGLLTNGICDFDKIIEISTKPYEVFVVDTKSYNRNLASIKHILLDK